MNQPGPIKIQMQETLTLLVVEIKENVKCFPTKTGLVKCRHDVVCKDKEGNISTFEYVTPQGAEIMFVPGVYQQVRCVFANEKGATVEPVIDGTHPTLIETRAQMQKADTNSKKVGGACYTFALGFAKDIFAGIVRRADINTAVTIKDIDNLLAIAETIQGELATRLGADADDANQYSMQIGGSSYLFALGYAKDVLLAEIAIRDIGSSILREDVSRMFEWADRLQNNMTERFTF